MGRPRKDGTPAAKPGDTATRKPADPNAPVIVKVKLARAEFDKLTAAAEADFRNPEMMAVVFVMKALRQIELQNG